MCSSTGSLVPADIRLIATKDFFVSQSALTGESMPVEKSAAPAAGNGKSALELANACFQGSNVLSGTARGVVVNTGAGPTSAPSRASSPAGGRSPASTRESQGSPG